MTPDGDRQVEPFRARLVTEERGGSDGDRRLVLEFSDRLSVQQYAVDRREKLRRYRIILSKGWRTRRHSCWCFHLQSRKWWVVV